MNEICDLVIAISTTAGVLVTLMINFAATTKKNSIDRHNAAFEIMTKCKKIQDNINHRLEFWIIKVALWKYVKDEMIPHYAKKDKDNLCLLGSLEADEKKSYHSVVKFISNNEPDIVSLQEPSKQLLEFYNDVSFLESCCDFRFSHFSKANRFLKKYMKALDNFKTACEEITANNMTPKKCLVDFVKALEIGTDLTNPDISVVKQNVDKYVNTFGENFKDDLNRLKTDTENVFEVLKKHLK